MKMLLWVLLALALVAVAGLLAFGWIMSNRFLVPKPYTLMPEFEILAVEEGSAADDGYVVTLPHLEAPDQFAEVTKEGVYNLLWEGGYGRLGPVIRSREGEVERRVTGVIGRPPHPGAPARLDVAVFRRDPLEDHGIDFEELELQGQAGVLHAWWIERDVQRAVLALHGRRRADRSETLRILPTIVDSGWSLMALAYRNHDSSDPSPDGFFHYGDAEYQDALTAVHELARRGVEEVVLYGFSMGGAVALEALESWPEDAPRLVGVILDSPLLDARTVIGQGARKAGLPFAAQATEVALFVGRLRSGIDWDGLDQRRLAPRIEVPVLLIGGTRDSTIPIELVDEFANRVEAPLEYLRLEGVEHVEGWNRARERYEAAVADFLARAARVVVRRQEAG